MTANEHTGVLGPMHGKEWKKGGGKEYNGDNEPTAEFVTTLDKLEPGQAGVILELNTGGGMRRRLMDLGFSAGEHVECVLKSLVRGTVTALRGKDAAEIKVRAEDGACNMCFAARCNSGAENKEG